MKMFSDVDPINPEGKHGWLCGCYPSDNPFDTGYATFKTFSFSFHRWVRKASRRGFKRQPIGYRLVGPSSKREAVLRRANEILAQLDAGWVPPTKSETLK